MRLLSCLVVVMLLASEHADSGQKAKPDKKNDTAAKAGRYLFYLPLATRSITIMVMPLAEELAARGHEIVMVMPVELKAKHKNIHIISFEDPFAALFVEMSKHLLQGGTSNNNIVEELHGYTMAGIEANDRALGQPELRRELDKGFDVVLCEMMVATETGYYLAHRSQASLVAIMLLQVSDQITDNALGQPHNTALLPFVLLRWQPPFSFTQRVINTVYTYGYQIYREWYVISKVEALLDKHFPGEIRVPLLELEKNISLALNWGHPMLMDGMRPVSPNFQFVGMLNCKPAQPLPKDLENFVAGAEHGIIYVSFGTVFQSQFMSEASQQLFLKVFGSLKQRVIWKWEKEEMAGKPDNVMLSKWLPQQDLLGHPNLKLFITHGGLNSFQETICHQKPVVVIPVAVDQPANALESERMGIGIHIPFSKLTEEKLREAILKVLQDPKYAQAAKEKGSVITDQETRPLDRALWWLEYVLRHKGKNHMVSPVHQLAWYQYLLLDIALFLAGIFLLLGYLVYKICRMAGGACKKDMPTTDKKKRQ